MYTVHSTEFSFTPEDVHTTCTYLQVHMQVCTVYVLRRLRCWFGRLSRVGRGRANHVAGRRPRHSGIRCLSSPLGPYSTRHVNDRGALIGLLGRARRGQPDGRTMYIVHSIHRTSTSASILRMDEFLLAQLAQAMPILIGAEVFHVSLVRDLPSAHGTGT